MSSPRPARVLLSLAAALGLGYAAVCGLLWAVQERMIFLPDARPLAADPTGRFATERLTTRDGLDLAFVVAPPGPGKPVVLVLHGNGGNASDRMRMLGPLTARGIGVVVAGYRGYGGNPGSPTETGLIEDGRAHLAWIDGRWPGQPLALWGESLGSGVAARLAAETPGLAALIFDSPFTALEDRAAELYPVLPVRQLLRHRFPVAALLPQVAAPVLVVHGEADPVIPAEHGRRVLAAARNGRGVFLPEVGHPAMYDPRAAPGMQAVLNLLAPLVVAPARSPVPAATPVQAVEPPPRIGAPAR